jgi:hypothetical protein
LIVTQTSVDGGLAWGPAVTTSIAAPLGEEPNGAQPMPRPDGSLTVVYAVGAAEDDDDTGAEAFRATESAKVLAATSTDGASSFSPAVQVADLTAAPVPDLRAPPLPSADVASDGRLFVVWQDCRFAQDCARNRIVLSTSADGITWSSPSPVPSSGATSSQFVPGLAADRTRPGAGQRLAVVYYSLTTTCAIGTVCPRIDVWLATSSSGGAVWSSPRRLDAQPMQLTWLPRSAGRFLGDYLSTSFVGGRPIPVFALAVTPWGGKLREAIMALQTG